MPCDSPYYVKTGSGDTVPVACGRCPPCKKRRVDGWAFRLMQEAKVSSSAYFVTMTYNTDHVPISPNGFMTLSKSDVQKFWKRLRKLQNSKIKYYLAGEYGSQNHRPHYHAIVFNVENIENFAKCWTFGDLHIGTVTKDSVAYTMKYIDKKGYVKKHERDDRVSEFALMSKGLGASYITDAMLRYHANDRTRTFHTLEGGHIIAMPNYYKQKIYGDFDDSHRSYISTVVDESRKQQFQKWYDIYKGTHLDYLQYVQDQKLHRYSKMFHKTKQHRKL
nr:MAG: replication initiator protein [Microvirus sp.]